MTMSAVIGDMRLEHPVMNAAGTCKTLEDVKRFARSSVSAIVLGSITLEPRLGNSGQTYWQGKGYALNSLGMPNQGIGYYSQNLPQMVEIAHEADKPLIVSVAGFNPAEYAELVKFTSSCGVDCTELNLGCPNIWDSGEQKSIYSFDASGIQMIFDAIARLLPQGRPIGVKLSPYSDPEILKWVAKTLAKTLADMPIAYAASSNTFPNAIMLDGAGKPVIDVGFAGMSGAAMKPVGLGQVMQLRRNLPDSIKVIGVGGVTDGGDVRDYLQAGATAVQAATAFWEHDMDPGVFSDILSTYVDLAEI